MHIGLVIYGSLHTVSGGYLYDRKLVENLEKSGDRVTVISLPERGYWDHFRDNISSRLLLRLTHLKLDLLLQDELNHPSLMILNRIIKRRVGFPIISIVHHLRNSETFPAWQKLFYRWAETQYLRGVDGYIFNSQATRQAVQDLAGVARPWTIAYPGGNQYRPDITEEEIQVRSQEPGPLRLLFVGNIIPRKGLITLLKALEMLPPQFWKLTVAGSLAVDPEYSAAARRMVEGSCLVGQVRFAGPVEDAELRRLYQSSHVLAVPSLYEGFGIVYLEGMGFGLPVIATTAGAAGEHIRPGINGYLIEPGDSVSLAFSIEKLANNRETLARMGLAARHVYLNYPTWEQTGSVIRSFLYLFTSGPV